MARNGVWYMREPVEILRIVRTEGGQLRSGRTKAAGVEYSSRRWLHCVTSVLKHLGSLMQRSHPPYTLASSTSGYPQLVARFGKRHRHLASQSWSIQDGRFKETCLFQRLDIISINSLKLFKPGPVVPQPFLCHLPAFCLHKRSLLRISQFWI